MAKLAVKSIMGINGINLVHAHALLTAFNVITPTDTKMINITHFRKLILESATVTAKLIDLKCHIRDILFCFDPQEKFICFHDSLNYSYHVMESPKVVSKEIFGQLPFVDKIKLIVQVSLADSNGMLQLPWTAREQIKWQLEQTYHPTKDGQQQRLSFCP